MSLDAIIIADSGQDSFSGTNPLRLELDGRTADIQAVINYLEHQGRIVPPVDGDGVSSWSSAHKFNGIYLLSYLTKHGYNVELIDSYYEKRNEFLRLLRSTPRAVIISTTFIYGKDAIRKLVEDIRSSAPDVFVIAGGPFIYASYRVLQKKKDPNYDTDSAGNDYLFLTTDSEPTVDLYIISPRGERLLCEALGRIKHGKSLDDLPNSARFTRRAYSFAKQIDDVSSAEEVPIDWETLPATIFESGVVPMQASNGCPYRCSFCNFTKDRRLMFVKPVDQLIAELRHVAGRGIRYVWFTDDNFRLGRSDLKTICLRLIEEDLQIQWMSFIRASTLKDIEGELLRQSGCVEVQLGLESGDTQILRNMNKDADPLLYAEVTRRILAAGVNCSCYFIFGFPGETDETARQTKEFIKTIESPGSEGVLTWSLFPFVLSPLSPIYEERMRERYGLEGYMSNWKHGTMDSRRAMDHLKRTFFEIENSGPIYRGDNMDILQDYSPRKRKEFVSHRHHIAKLATKDNLDRHEILESFAKLALKRN